MFRISNSTVTFVGSTCSIAPMALYADARSCDFNIKRKDSQRATGVCASDGAG
ncbi:hypothetical protein [Mesorhizobium sp.]|uniref:hypothetical protein n=1 Tax=Mesorhizobium sp. TaxID=1871066 RepID=UPI0025C5114A|nr:hypothetical protein [Mesorhizobium sp.]